MWAGGVCARAGGGGGGGGGSVATILISSAVYVKGAGSHTAIGGSRKAAGGGRWRAQRQQAGMVQCASERATYSRQAGWRGVRQAAQRREEKAAGEGGAAVSGRRYGNHVARRRGKRVKGVGVVRGRVGQAGRRQKAWRRRVCVCVCVVGWGGVVVHPPKVESNQTTKEEGRMKERG